MGCNFMLSKSSNDDTYYTSEKPNINPNPSNFKMLRRVDKGNISLIEVRFENCINYEGNKIIVMDKLQLEESIRTNNLDPHFSNKGQTVIARFEPTIKGWEMAKEFIEKCNI